MRRIARPAGVLAFVLMLGASDRMKADAQPQPQPEAVDRILAEWQTKMSAVTAIDIRFRIIDSTQWGDVREVGHAVLAAPNRALLERYKLDADGKAGRLLERLIWQGKTILRFDAEQHRVDRFHPREEWPAAPGPLRLPFFYRMTVEEANRDYVWSLLKETEDQILLRAVPTAQPDPLRVTDEHFVWLDRRTFLPKILMIRRTDGGRQVGRTTYEAVEIKLNPAEGLDEQLEPCMDSWDLVECGEPEPFYPFRQLGEWLKRSLKK